MMTVSAYRFFMLISVGLIAAFVVHYSHQQISDMLQTVKENPAGIDGPERKEPVHKKKGSSAFGATSGIGAFGTRHKSGFNADQSDSVGHGKFQGIPSGIAAEISAASENPLEIKEVTTGDYWLAYGDQLLYTASASVPAALIVALSAYIMSVLESVLKFGGWARVANLVSQPFELLPNIFWILPFATLARWLYSLQPESGSLFYDIVVSETAQSIVSWTYQYLIYLGFGFFLLIFFFRENSRKLTECEQIIESEKLMGTGAVSLYLSLFINAFFKQIFIRQLAFCTLFIFLMDFAFLTIIDVNQAYSTATVFSESARLQHSQKTAEQEIKNQGKENYSGFLQALSDNRSDNNILSSLIDAVQSNPSLLLSPDWRRKYQSVCRNEGTVRMTDCLPGDTRYEWQVLPESQFRNVYFQEVSSFYFRQNVLIIFVMFIAIFSIFDCRILIDER